MCYIGSVSVLHLNGMIHYRTQTQLKQHMEHSLARMCSVGVTLDKVPSILVGFCCSNLVVRD